MQVGAYREEGGECHLYISVLEVMELGPVCQYEHIHEFCAVSRGSKYCFRNINDFNVSYSEEYNRLSSFAGV